MSVMKTQERETRMTDAAKKKEDLQGSHRLLYLDQIADMTACHRKSD